MIMIYDDEYVVQIYLLVYSQLTFILHAYKKKILYVIKNEQLKFKVLKYNFKVVNFILIYLLLLNTY